MPGRPSPHRRGRRPRALVPLVTIPCLHVTSTTTLHRRFIHCILHNTRRSWSRPLFWSEPLLAAYPLCRCGAIDRSEEHTSELQSRENLVCRLLLEKKK